MKARIVGQLALLADPNGKSPYRSDLCAELKCSPSDLSEHACKALNALLIDFGNFNISTIDAFSRWCCAHLHVKPTYQATMR